MKRRTFIVNTSLSALALSLFPKLILANNKSYVLQELNSPQYHVRHGLFNLNDFQELNSALSISQNIFYKNGYTICPDGLDPHLITINQNSKTFKTMIEGESIKALNAPQKQLQYLTKDISSPFEAGDYIIPIKGAIQVDGVLIAKDQFLSITADTILNITVATKHTIYLIIKKT